jgi:hypoxanthine phosphoribosyltransferase
MNETPVATIHADVEEILLTEEQIQARVAELGTQLTADYAGRDPVLISVLKGSIVFLADLVRGMEVPLSIDIMEVSSYGAATESSGQVRILKDLSNPIEGRHVIVVEDIIDTGLTLNYLLRYLREKGPASLAICCLLDKPARRLTSPIGSSSAMGSTTGSAIGTCPTSGSSVHRSTGSTTRRPDRWTTPVGPDASGSRSWSAPCSWWPPPSCRGGAPAVTR